MAKTALQHLKLEGLDLSFFGTLDFCMFFFYALAQFATGSLGDHFDKRWVLAISYSVQAVMFVMLAIAGACEFTSHSYYIFCFVVAGLAQSVVFPTLVGVVGSWFGSTHRGLITGSWGTCTNVGNIIGVQSAARILNGEDPSSWHFLMEIVAIAFLANVLLIGCVYEPSPEGLIIDKDALLEQVRMDRSASVE